MQDTYNNKPSHQQLMSFLIPFAADLALKALGVAGHPGCGCHSKKKGKGRAGGIMHENGQKAGTMSISQPGRKNYTTKKTSTTYHRNHHNVKGTPFKKKRRQRRR